MKADDLSFFSLIYPDEKAYTAHCSGAMIPDIDMYTLGELGLLEFLTLKNTTPSEFCTCDPKTIKYRADTFIDMLENESLSAMLNKLIPILTDIMELRRLEADNGDTDSYLSSMTEIELYISCIDLLHSGLSNVRDKLKGAALRTLADRISEFAESDYYKELNQKLSELTKRVREIKSVTVGVNLDQQLKPTSAGVLSINSDSFKSGDVIDKILRLNFKDDSFTCIANLVPFSKGQTENQKTALSLAFNSAINDVYRSSLRSWKKIVQSYVLDNTDFLLGLMPEIEFITKGTEMLRALKNRGFVLTLPKILPDGTNRFTAKGLYNPCVALKLPEGEEIVPNDIEFSDDDCMIYVLTGPNRGGKSVITCAIGLAQAMLQLGMPVSAEHAEISTVDGIYTHFPTGADDTIDKGRLGEECARLGEIFDCITENSLVLLDESLSSTGSYEASYIASEVLEGFCDVGCRVLFSTHLHELAGEIDQINRRSAERGGSKIDTLVAGIEEGKRSFKIVRAKPDGKSYARDIAGKYGLTYEKISEKLKK